MRGEYKKYLESRALQGFPVLKTPEDRSLSPSLESEENGNSDSDKSTPVKKKKNVNKVFTPAQFERIQMQKHQKRLEALEGSKSAKKLISKLDYNLLDEQFLRRYNNPGPLDSYRGQLEVITENDKPIW